MSNLIYSTPGSAVGGNMDIPADLVKKGKLPVVQGGAVQDSDIMKKRETVRKV